ncbi:erythropoietin receptor isoform X2 [Betta splendens]|uniref:Erythropoietin receptor n=1 Tax=Betta splendens TaxID=158456 RepID=A0A6P7N9G3_BETSP|nr:erythropoietin receptor isoform X2 [Betta splendens]
MTLSLLLEKEPTNPKCFAQSLTDFTCFWEDDEERTGSVDQYTFTYSYQNENSSRCRLRAEPAGGRRLFLCHLNRTKMFVQMFVHISRDGKPVYNRSLLIDQLFLLDPPANVTVSSAGQRCQLHARWLPPPIKYMDDSLMYQVSYAAAGGGAEQVETVLASTELRLRGLQPGTTYGVRVRVKLDGITYGGFWSAWSEPVLTETLPAEPNPLIISLTLIISLILIVLSLSVFLSHRRFLQKKIWPTIPTPDNKFHGLFSVHGGDFKEWLRQSSGGLWLTPAFCYSEECPFPLEVLSELSVCPTLPSPKASRASDGREQDCGAAEDWGAAPRDRLMNRLRALHQHEPSPQSSLLESKDAYVTLCSGQHPAEKALTLEVLLAPRKAALSECHSDLGSVPQSSGSGRLSSQSSFEYPTHSWMPKGPGYIYMAGADSGVSMDYSPMSRADDTGKVVLYANDYKNDMPAFSRPVLTRQNSIHDDG